nr:hypothetical protein [Tanacetum cinerariifolium]
MEMLFTINPRPCPTMNANSIVESTPSSLILIQDNDSQREEIDIVTSTDDLLPPGFENDDSDEEIKAIEELHVYNSIFNAENELSINEESDFDNPSVPRPPSKPPDAEFDFEPDIGDEISVLMNTIVEFDVSNDENDDCFSFMFVIRIFMPYLICSKVFSFLLSAESEDTIFDPVNGDSPPLMKTINGVEKTYTPTTVEEKLARKNELKTRGTLLMALPNEHQLKFNSYKNAKSLMESIKKRLPKLISQLEIHRETISQEDLNMKLLRSLPSEWKTHTLIWRNKPDLETLSIDDLYNNLKIYETEVKSLQLDNEDLQQIDSDNLKEMDLKWEMAIFNHEGQKIPKEDWKEDWAPTKNRNKEHVRRNVTVETTDANALVAQDGFKYDWSDQAKDGPTNFALMAYTSLGAYKASLESIEARLDVYKKNEAVFEEEIKILKLDVMFRDNALTYLRKKLEKAEKERDEIKITLEKFKSSSKTLNKMLDSQVNDKNKIGIGYHAVPPLYNGNFMPLKPNLILHDVDEYVVSESVTSVPAVATNEAKTSELKAKSISELIIEDWVSDSEDENETETDTKSKQKNLVLLRYGLCLKVQKSPKNQTITTQDQKPPGAIMEPATQRRKSLIQVSTGLQFIKMLLSS